MTIVLLLAAVGLDVIGDGDALRFAEELLEFVAAGTLLVAAIQVGGRRNADVRLQQLGEPA